MFEKQHHLLIKFEVHAVSNIILCNFNVTFLKKIPIDCVRLIGIYMVIIVLHLNTHFFW